jgi:membrane associated rhomboid family serine protease
MADKWPPKADDGGNSVGGQETRDGSPFRDETNLDAHEAVRHRRPHLINAPYVVTGLLGVLIAIHAAAAGLEWLGQEERVAWWQWALAFVPARYFGTGHDIPGGTVAAVTSVVTHTLLHADIAHLMINGAGLLAFGAVIARRVGAVRFLALYVLSAVAGAAMFLAIRGNTDAVVIGASGAISGLLGGAFRFFFRMLEARHNDVPADVAQNVPRMRLREMVREPRVRLAVIVWLIANYLVALMSVGMSSGGGIAWEAHLGGFLFGLFAFGVFDRPDDLLSSNH